MTRKQEKIKILEDLLIILIKQNDKIKSLKFIGNVIFHIDLYDENFEKNINCMDELIPFNDGKVINIINLEVRDRVKTDYFCSEFPVKYDDNLNTDDAQTYLNILMNYDANSVEFLHKFLGYSMTGFTCEKLILINYGGDNIAKQSLFNLMGKIMGKFYELASGNLFIENSKSDRIIDAEILSLKHTRLVIYHDMQDNEKLDIYSLRRLSGNDELSVRKRNCPQTTIKPKTKMAVIANQKPKNSDNKSLLERIKLLNYPTNFVNKLDEERFERLIDELNTVKLNNFFTYIVMGANKWYHNMGLHS